MTNRLSRRLLLKSSALLPFTSIFANAANQEPQIRFNARSTEGKAMLAKYARAVQLMQSAKESDPRSWTFQWYSHWVKGSSTVGAEISRIYGSTQTAARDLAEQMWDSCQAHGQNEQENNFLPWHRMYVYFFERILRNVLGDPTFTLPYWNYSDPNVQVHGIIPDEFRQQSDPNLKSLYRDNRNAGVNAGVAIDKAVPASSLDTSALQQPTYSPNGPNAGFCSDLDTGLHGNVHVLVGNPLNMGAVPWAAGDPIFWLHHCNLDRLWASWNKNGGQNPSGPWLSTQFTFADENGNKISAAIGDFLSIEKLGYGYDSLEPAPLNFNPLSESTLGVSRALTLLRRPSISLEPRAVRVQLKPEQSSTFGASIPLDRNTGNGSSFYLLLRNFSAAANPGALFGVSLEASTSPPMSLQLATINFFDLSHPMANMSGTSKFISIDVTSAIRRINQENVPLSALTVVFTPLGVLRQNSRPVIGEVSVVAG